MTLKEHIDDIRSNLTKEVFTSEALVSEGIVRRLLEALNWPKYDPQIIIPEFSVGKGERVDFALCHPALKPRVFIEVKQVGQIDEDAKEQLFKYAGRKNIPIAVLTDGREWYFFYPSGLGDHDERRVYQLNLIETHLEESAQRLSRYLNYESIRTGNAITAIENDHREISMRRQIEDVWNTLLQQEAALIELIAREVESRHGNKPSSEQVVNFLKNLPQLESNPKEIPLPPIPSPPVTSSSRFVVTMSDGERIDCPVAADTFADVIEKLGLEQVEKVNPKLLSTSNTYRAFRQRGRYYINVGFSNGQKKKILDNLANALGARLRVESHPKDVPPPPSQQEPQNSIGKKPPIRFVVTMPDGERIDRPVAADTFADVIEKLGLAQAEKIEPKHVSTSNTYRNFKRRGQYFIDTNLTNRRKKNILENIAEALGVRLNVKIVPKN